MFQSLAKVACVLAVTVIGTNVQAAGDAEAGQAKAATCVACHGVDGNSAVPTFPKLSGLGHKYLLKQMQDIRDGRRPVALMAGQVDNMTDQDLSDIAAFYDAQPRTGGTADPDKVSLGRKVYLGGIAERQVPACSGCHSPTGNGNGPAGYPGAGRSACRLRCGTAQDVSKGLRGPRRPNQRRRRKDYAHDGFPYE